GTKLADAGTLHTVARHALRREHGLTEPRRIVGGKRIRHCDLRPSMRGRFDPCKSDGLIGPLLGADLGALGVLPYEIERPGGGILSRQRWPGRGWILDGDPSEATAMRTLL